MKIYVKAATDNSDKWVIVNRELHFGKPSTWTNQLFIAPEKYRDNIYFPTWTSVGRRNYDRAKLFNSKEEVQAYIDKQNKEKQLFLDYNDKDHSKTVPKDIEILPYSEAMVEIGDPEQNYKDYKQKQADDKKAYSERYKERYKKEHAKDKEKNPGKYKVWFYYSNSWLGGESFTVDAESIDDAFKKAKAKALAQDPYRATSGYDQRMTFSKNYIKKIS